MAIEVGNPEYLGVQPPDGVDPGDIYLVPVSKRSSSGRLLATGKVTVVVPNDQGYDEATMKELAKQKAIAMVAENPELLTPITVSPPGGTHVERDGEGNPVWDGPGFLDPPEDDPDTDEPSRILSPDSPQTGQ